MARTRKIHKEKFQSKTGRIIKSRLFLFVSLVILILFSVALVKEILRQWEVNKEIDTLQDEIAELEKQNTQLNELIQYLNTNIYTEKESRLKLGMQKPGESVIAINLEQTNNSHEDSHDNPDYTSVNKINNPLKWLNYFFK